MDEVRDRLIGTIVDDRYRILSRIAAGGMGVVYRAERIQIKRAMAIKFLHVPPGSQSEFTRRFKVEAKAMSRLSHPNCVSIIDFGVHETPYLVMDFVTGKTLRSIMERGRVPVSRAINICRQLLAGLAHAHNKQIVHRDVKPANIIVREDVTGTGDLVRILDFGLAKLRDAGASIDASKGNVALGTPHYMAPEQIRGGDVDARSDLYSVGIVLFELLTGRKPFYSEEVYDVLKMQLEDPPPRLEDVDPNLKPSRSMEAVIAKALAKDRAQRYQTAHGFAEALRYTPEAKDKSRSDLAFADTLAVDIQSLSDEISAVSQPSSPISTTQPPLPSSLTRSRRWILWAALFLGALGLAALLVTQNWARKGITDQLRTWALWPRQDAGQVHQAAPRPRAVRTGVASTARNTDADMIAGADADRPADTGDDMPADAGPGDLEPDIGVADLAADQSSLTMEEPDIGSEELPEVDEKPAVRKKKPPSSGKEKRVNGAIRKARRLVAKYPKRAYLAFSLGRLYCKKKYYTDCIKAYRQAIRLDRKYRKTAPLIRDSVNALSSKQAHRLASWLIARHIGSPALPYLRKTARSHKSTAVRGRAKWLLDRLKRGKRR